MRVAPDGVSPGGRFAGWQPSSPRWVLLDVDGTILGLNGVTPGTADACCELMQAGIRVGLATGRLRQAAMALVHELGLDGPHVFHNGAEVHDGRTSVVQLPLADTDAEELTAIAADLDTYAELYVDQGYYVTKDDPRSRAHWEALGLAPLGQVHERGDGPVLKATFMCFDGAETRRVVAAITAAGMQPGPAHAPATPGVTYVNATARGVDKGAAVTEATGRLGLRLSEIVAIGDGDNDVPLFDVAGTAIAMGQAHPDVQAAAHLVTAGVDEGGAALALRAAARIR